MSRSDLREYLLADLLANGRQTWTFSDRWHYPLLHFQRHLRRAEYILNCKSGKLWTGYRAFASWSLRKHGAKLGFTIIQNFFGPGLSVTHWGEIADQERFQRARCRIHQGICLGWKVGNMPHLLREKHQPVGSRVPSQPSIPTAKGVLS
jgi:serine O-acetyltransferase